MLKVKENGQLNGEEGEGGGEKVMEELITPSNKPKKQKTVLCLLLGWVEKWPSFPHHHATLF